MGETTGSRFDRLAEEAWTRFRARLADHVAEMGDDDVLIVDTDPDDAATGGALPYVQFCAYDAGRVRCEVSSNAYLVPERRLDAQGAAAVVALGWSDPADGEAGNFYVDAERVEADRLAVMTVGVLREVFGVPHPSFLAAGGLELDPGQGVADSERPGEPAEPLAIRPRDRDHLRELVDEALTPFLGQAPEHDEDDDIPVPTRTSVVFVRVREDMPVVQMFAFVADDVEDTAAARFEVGVLNRDERFFKFSLVADSVMVELDLPALPFAPAHARDMLGILCATVDRIQPDLQERIGGTADTDDDADEDDRLLSAYSSQDEVDDAPLVEEDAEAETDALHPAMLTLLELDADRPGSVTAEMAASVCSWDRELILELITWNSEQEGAWRRARDRAQLLEDQDEAAVCEHERAHAERTTRLLRRALRLVVETRMNRQRWRMGYPHPLRDRGPFGGRDTRDPSLPGLDLGPDRQPGLFDVE